MAEITSPRLLMSAQPLKKIALLPWGDLIEDFLDSIGISFTSFCQEMTGGWLFGYVEALKLAGIETVLFCISARVTEPTEFIHIPTGSTICVLPASQLYRLVRRSMHNPYGWTLEEVFGKNYQRIPWASFFKNLAPYLATPLYGLAQAIRHYGCQAILCQEYEYARFDICVLLGKLLRLPVFATFQGGNWQSSHYERYFRSHTLRACRGLIVATQTERQRLQDVYHLPDDKISTIFNPLDLKLWFPSDQQQARQALNIAPDTRVAIYHGRIEIHRKGLDMLLQAWQQVYQERSPQQDFRLLLVGTGSDAEALKSHIESMQLSGVTWINEYILDRNLMRLYLAAADVSVLPSRHEGFPVAPLEAMACGLPVVATDAPGVPDIFECGEAYGGIVVPREDPKALAVSLQRILLDPSFAQRIGEAARTRIEQAFTMPAVSQQLSHFITSRQGMD